MNGRSHATLDHGRNTCSENKHFWPAIAGGLCITACTVERTPHLYPTNDVAVATGVLTGRFVGHGNLQGIAELSMPDGELLQGEYSVVAGGSIGFGNIFSAVYAPQGIGSASGNATAMSISGSGQGSVSLFGNRGTAMQCELLNNNFTGHAGGPACGRSLYRASKPKRTFFGSGTVATNHPTTTTPPLRTR